MDDLAYSDSIYGHIAATCFPKAMLAEDLHHLGSRVQVVALLAVVPPHKAVCRSEVFAVLPLVAERVHAALVAVPRHLVDRMVEFDESVDAVPVRLVASDDHQLYLARKAHGAKMSHSLCCERRGIEGLNYLARGGYCSG